MLKWMPEWSWDVEIVLEDCNFLWSRRELEELKEMWEKNYSITYMSDYLKRSCEEIMLALMHLARKREITQKKISFLAGI